MMTTAQKHRVYWAMALTIVAIFGAGVAYWVTKGVHDYVCADHKLPVAQQSDLMGQVIYRCHNGQIVTGSPLP